MARKLAMLRERTRLIPLILSLIFIIYAVGRFVTALPALDKPRDLADTDAYLRISRQPLLVEDFWASTRPLVFPLLLKITEQDLRRTAVIQLGVSLLAWGFLGWRIARFVRAASLQIPVFGLILAFSLDRHIAGWDFVMMTESLSVSFLAVFIGLTIWLLEGWATGKLLLLLLAGLLLAFVRDTNAWLLLMLAGLFTVAVLFRWMNKRALILSVGFSTIFLMSFFVMNKGYRWIFPLGNLIGQRVLPYGTASRFFEDCGMPVSPALVKLAGQFANAQERAMFEDPQLENFRDWLMEDGRSCYVRWLVADPEHSLGEVLENFNQLVSFPNVDGYFSRRYDPWMPIVLGKFFYPEVFPVWIWILTTLGAVIAIWRRLWKGNILWAEFICINLLVFPHLFVTWHGDAMAPERHALAVGVQLYFSVWLLVILIVEMVWLNRTKHPSQGTLPEQPK